MICCRTSPERAPPRSADWQPLTPDGATRARQSIQRLGTRSGPVYANFKPADLCAYIFQELSRELPPSAEQVEAAVVNDQLMLRASMKLSDLGGLPDLGP